MAKIRLPMHCPEDIQQWLYEHKVAVTPIDAPYDYEFEAPLDTIIDMILEGWAIQPSSTKLVGEYLLNVKDLRNDEVKAIADRVLACLRTHLDHPNLRGAVCLESSELLWWDEEESQWCVNGYRFEFDLDRYEWTVDVDPMPTKTFV